MSRSTYPRSVEAEVAFTPRVLAEVFADMSDEDQAQFFIEVAEIACQWEQGANQGWQWSLVGGHLRDCSCSSPEARDIVRAIARGIGDDE